MAIVDTALAPFRVATSKPAQKTYLNTFLFLITSTVLLGVAIVAYGLFYFNFVPQIGIERVIHLQYGDGRNPYGIVPLSTSLISQQPYDITLSLHVPRSPANIRTGNFMLSLSLLSSSYKPLPPITTTDSPLAPTVSSSLTAITPEDILFSSRRPAILTYTSRLISLSERLAALPLYILGLRRESEFLTIPMAELISFPRGRKNIPGHALVEVLAGQEIQVYSLTLKFTARFEGFRYLMYNHRLLSLVIGVATFWSAEVLSMIFTWFLLRLIFLSSSEGGKGSIKGEETDTSVGIKNGATDEEPELSDTPRTFPTYGRQAPLKYEPRIKKEDNGGLVLQETDILPLSNEADDEDDEDLGFKDSGLGTSYSDAGGRGGVTRRRSKGKGGAGH
ncbi:hypothetical protein HYALB_00004076 [Hymenoscyphus albidus]|uniref:Seipin n=1 Tax=Hymenoscyphus albidus TaxID=595503 RepID=A0A9N9LYI1_9HELO|nr:hypothetical protein HYALB_00004076 [Hymenoscyphus albidus]